MTRLSRIAVAGLASIAWTPLWMHLPFGAALLQAQQSHTPHVAVHVSADTDSDENADSDDDDDDKDDDASKVVSSSSSRAAMRTIDVSRMMRPSRDATTPLRVDVSYGAGSLTVAPGNDPWLYDVRIDYLARHNTPAVSFDSTAHSLTVSGSTRDDIKVDMGDHKNHATEDARVTLSHSVPLDIHLAFGGGNVTADLGGLKVQRLNLETGGAEAELRFRTPDPVPLEELNLKVGAAGFEATGLGNAHVRRMTVQALAGDVNLDFGGQWTGDANVDVTAAVGAVHIHVPQNVAVDLDHSSKMIVGDSENNTGAATALTPGGPIYHLRVHSTATLGSIEFDRKTRE
jgi:hypothetical protein